MCGIAGFIDPTASRESAELVALAEAMAVTLTHRGPDDAGTWVDPAVGLALGHRRLAILDLRPTGHQPMVSADGRHVLVFNGELYNHRDIRERLEKSGVTFRGTSDTEVLVEAIARWGLRRALECAEGMWALAVWDRHERVLRLARDRVGEKPLYFGKANGTFLFSSELKALKEYPGFSPPVHRRALDAFLRYGYIPAPLSIYEGIQKLPPGTFMIVGSDGEPGEPTTYWSFLEVAVQGNREPLNVDDDTAVELVEAALRRSVGLRMLADVPVGALLSGGIDSSTVVALMQAQSPGAARTFTVGFEEPGFNEASHAAAIARHLGTEHTELTATPADALGLVSSLPRAYDEPFADSSQLPTMLVCALTRRGVTVGLSGDAGDEVFGGYVRHALLERIWSRRSWMPRSVRSAAARGISVLRPATLERLAGAARHVVGPKRIPSHPAEKAHKLARVLRAATIDDAYDALVTTWTGSPAVLGFDRDQSVPALTIGDLPAYLSVTERVMLRDSTTYLPDDILTKVDRASMSVSLEARVPMLDHKLIELVWRLPQARRREAGETKWLLRRVLAEYVPEELTNRPKMGFAVPVAEWLRGPLKSWADDLLDRDTLRADGYLDDTIIRHLWQEHLGRARDHGASLWSVLMFQAWLGEARSALPSASASHG